MIALTGCLSGRVVMFDIRTELFGCGDIFAEIDGLRNSVEYGVRYQNCVNHEKTIDDFCALAVNCRLKIFEVVRSNRNINHPVKDVIRALDVLMAKVDKFKGRQEWRLDCSECPCSPLDRFIYHYCMDAGNLGSVELLNIKNELELAFVKESKFDDEYFRRFVRISFANLMRDMVKLMNESGLKIRFSNEIATIESHSLFFVFLKVLEFCEYEFEGLKFLWLPWVREKASCNSLERLLLNRMDVIRGSRKRQGKPIKVPHYADANSFEPYAYEVIDFDGVRMEGDLGALYGCTEMDAPVFKGQLPEFFKG